MLSIGQSVSEIVIYDLKKEKVIRSYHAAWGQNEKLAEAFRFIKSKTVYEIHSTLNWLVWSVCRKGSLEAKGVIVARKGSYSIDWHLAGSSKDIILSRAECSVTKGLLDNIKKDLCNGFPHLKQCLADGVLPAQSPKADFLKLFEIVEKARQSRCDVSLDIEIKILKSARNRILTPEVVFIEPD